MSYTTTARGYSPRQIGTGGYAPARMFATISLMMTVARERRQLRALDPAMLKDLGLDRADVRREAARPMWDLPAGRTA